MNDGDLLASIGDLPPPALDERGAARIQQAARAAFLAAAAGRGGVAAPGGGWIGWWKRALEPLLVAGAVAGYLAWTAAAMNALDRQRRSEPSAEDGAPRIGAKQSAMPIPELHR